MLNRADYRMNGGDKVSKMIVNEARCKACGCCIKECPRGAISFTTHRNKKGYESVMIDESKCTQCGICYYVCPDCVFEREV